METLKSSKEAENQEFYLIERMIKSKVISLLKRLHFFHNPAFLRVNLPIVGWWFLMMMVSSGGILVSCGYDLHVFNCLI